MGIYTSSYVKVDHITQDTGNVNQEGYVSDAGLMAVAVNIQPSAPEIIALNNGAFGKAYTVFAPLTASGILETDRLTTVSGTDSRQYIVKGKQYFNYGLGQHLELYTEQVQ